MKGSGTALLRTRPTTKFKKHDANKKGRCDNFSREFNDYPEDSNPSDTIYRILCPSRKIGGVIGKGGNVVKTLRGETQAKITVAESMPGSDERVITIYSTSTGSSSRKQPEIENTEEGLQPHCAAQNALLRVHEKIIEEDLADNADNDTSVTARLLVPNNLVGCVIGKGGDVIQSLRSETGAVIRVLPPDLLPTCAMSSDELVQISGKPAIVKRALFEISTRLHQNPRKDRPSNTHVPFKEPVMRHPGPPLPDVLPRTDPRWPQHNSGSRMPPSPWMREYKDLPDPLMLGGIDDNPVRHGESLGEFSVKILCSDSKVGSVIGKGGVSKRMIEQETGAKISIERSSTESEERVINLSAFETLQNPRSQVIDAILQLQNKTSELSEKGTITTRLLVPSSKVGCIIGQAGSVINEMRKRTRAEIRVYSKEERPNCALEDEELVQVSGSFAVAKDALAEIASRLRLRCLRTPNTAQPAPDEPIPGFSPARSFVRGGMPPPHDLAGDGGSVSYDRMKGDLYDYEPPTYPARPSAPGYGNASNSSELKFRHSGVGTDGGPINNPEEIAGPRLNFQGSQTRGAEFGMNIHGSANQLNDAQSRYHSFMPSGKNNPQHGSYPNPHHEQGHYQPISPPHRGHYQPISPYQEHYQPVSPQQGHYQPISPLQGYYQPRSPQQGHYQPISPQQGHYQPISSQQAPYQSVNPQQIPYQSINAPQSSYQNVSNPHKAYHYTTAYNPYQY